MQFSGKNRRFIFSIDDGQLLISTNPLQETVRRWKGNVEAHYLDDLRSDPDLESIVTKGRMASKVIGTVSERFFYRRAAGPGWALAGDAGHHKDPILGWGIAEALVQAKQLAEAIQAGGDASLERYWRLRDVDTLPRFRLGEERAKPQPLRGVFSVVLNKVRSLPGLQQQLFSETEYHVNPYALLPPAIVARWTLAAALRGRPGLILDFVEQGRRIAAVKKELKERRMLLEAVTLH